jgi:CheY-like chemotaxis protein
MASAPQPAKTVLIVEDDDMTCEALRCILESEGYPVAVAANGREALNYLYRNSRPLLILLDLMMPVMNGWEFRRQQKRDPALAGIPVVVCSAVGDIQQEVALIQPAGCLQKPIEAGQLLDTVRRLCPDGPGQPSPDAGRKCVSNHSGQQA